MKFLVFGAGALGSFIGGMLSKKHDVKLIGRKGHISTIEEKGLRISGKTKMVARIKKKMKNPDSLILTVKSYDTREAIMDALPFIGEETRVLSLQNGIGNEEEIGKIIGMEKVIGGITSHGITYIEPGHVRHAGEGETIIGEMDGTITNRIKSIARAFSDCGIITGISENIEEEIWSKAIVNSAINPLTAMVKCKNGYLLENPWLEHLLEKTCEEGMEVAKAMDMNLDDLVKKAKDVVTSTSDNHSSMLQSILHGKPTEIDYINGKIVEVGKKYGIPTPINELLMALVKGMEGRHS